MQQQLLKVTQQAEEKKYKKYSEIAKTLGTTITGFGCSLKGSLGPNVQGFLNQIANESAMSLKTTRSKMYNIILLQLGCALARASATAFYHAYAAHDASVRENLYQSNDSTAFKFRRQVDGALGLPNTAPQ